MARLRHYPEYWFMLGATQAANALSPAGADRLAVSLGRAVWRLFPSRRRIAHDNLERALGDQLSPRDREEIVRLVFENMARTIVEGMRYRQLTPARLLAMVEGSSAEHVVQAEREGKGGQFLTAHFGNWELAVAWGGAYVGSLHFIVARQSNRMVSAMFNRQRGYLGGGIIETGTQTMRNVIRSLRRNQFIGVAADQHAPEQALMLDFFGRKASFARGPALFSIRTGGPLLPCLLRRIRYDRFEAISHEPIYPPTGGDEAAAIRSMTERYARFLEQTIARYPEQWMWTHRRWKVDS